MTKQDLDRLAEMVGRERAEEIAGFGATFTPRPELLADPVELALLLERRDRRIFMAETKHGNWDD